MEIPDFIKHAVKAGFQWFDMNHWRFGDVQLVLSDSTAVALAVDLPEKKCIFIPLHMFTEENFQAVLFDNIKYLSKTMPTFDVTSMDENGLVSLDQGVRDLTQWFTINRKAKVMNVIKNQ